MSENFDKEAERERLREKYESDSADRAVTERMSQLLLQGATMTNTHCDTCGSPIFRYQGQEFCPTCQAEAKAGDAETAQDADVTTQNTETAGQNAERGGEEAQSGAQSASNDVRTTPESGPAPSQGSADPQQHQSVGGASTGTAELGASQPTQSSPDPAGESGDSATGTSSAVERSLAETIVTLSDRARTSEDPHQAKAFLEAAREAAETFATLQGR